MIINMTTPILSYEGKPMKTKSDDGAERDFTIRDAIVSSLNNLSPEKMAGTDKKVRVYKLALEAYKNDEVDYNVTDLAFIKECAGDVLTPVALGRLVEVIDPQGDISTTE